MLTFSGIVSGTSIGPQSIYIDIPSKGTSSNFSEKPTTALSETPPIWVEKEFQLFKMEWAREREHTYNLSKLWFLRRPRIMDVFLFMASQIAQS